ncbi:MAG: MBL fold metallo-hydrolase [Chloroflexota bacterium]|nr:MBL fold metallo-hydrolase [Chloroflexota bacterium]
MILESLSVGMLQVNCYILGCEQTNQGVIIDPGGNASGILNLVNQLGLSIVSIPNTHAHFDHILAVDEVKAATGAPFWLHRDDQPVLKGGREMVKLWMGYDPGPMPEVDSFISAGDTLHVGEEELEVRLAPGHSPGSVIFIHHDSRRVIGGDVLFAGGVGRFDFPGSDGPTLLRSIHEQLLTLPDDYAVFPGHGPATTIGRERQANPYLQPGMATLFES